MADVLYREEIYNIVGACFEVYNEQGCGFLEAVYQKCLEIELAHRNIRFVSQPELALMYRGQKLRQTYKPDFICYDKILIELKSVSELVDQPRAQVLNYLHATGLQLGILINFGSHPKLVYERIALTKTKTKI